MISGTIPDSENGIDSAGHKNEFIPGNIILIVPFNSSALEMPSSAHLLIYIYNMFYK